MGSPDAERPLWQSVLAGSAGGLACTLVGHPFESVKVRIQTGHTKHLFRGLYAGVGSPIVGVTPIWAWSYAAWRIGYDVQPDTRDEVPRAALAGAFSGLAQVPIKTAVDATKIVAQNERTTSVEALKKLWRAAGVRGVFKGFAATAIHMPGSTAAFFGTYEVGSRWLEREWADVCSLGMRSFLAGGLAGCVEWTLFMPTDVVKTRVQAGNYASYRAAVADVYTTFGVAGFYRGFWPTIVRAFPANGAAFVAIEGVNRFLADAT